MYTAAMGVLILGTDPHPIVAIANSQINPWSNQGSIYIDPWSN